MNYYNCNTFLFLKICLSNSELIFTLQFLKWKIIQTQITKNNVTKFGFTVLVHFFLPRLATLALILWLYFMAQFSDKENWIQQNWLLAAKSNFQISKSYKFDAILVKQSQILRQIWKFQILRPPPLWSVATT